MNQEDRKLISNGLFDVIDRLRSLREHPIVPFESWPDIAKTINLSHVAFRNTIDCYITACEYDRSNLSSIPVPFSIWKARLSTLWSKIEDFRTFHNRLFCHDYTDIIYHHILIEEMFSCFPENLPGSRTRFLVSPSGELMIWLFKEALASSPPPWFEQEYIEKIEALIDNDPITCFECHREKNFERQYVLAHELFHIICLNNESLQNFFKSFVQNTHTQNILDPKFKYSWPSQIEELFCDYAAVWFFGPMYMKSFADEMSYFSAQGSDTHPAGHIRAQMLLVNNYSYRSHRGYKAISIYNKLKKVKNLDKRQKLILKKWGDQFSKAMKDIDINKYKFNDKSSLIGESFAANIPFVMEDVRDLVNSLPDKHSYSKTEERYSLLVSESLRKTNILRQAKKYVRRPDQLFAIPEALSVVPSKGKKK